MTKYINVKKAQNEAWILYDKWRKKKIVCPAFKTQVNFSLLGWRHIIGATGHKKRTSDDIYRRLKLLPHAKQIIEESTTIQNITKHGKRFYYALEAMVEVIENSRKEFRKVRVVIIEDKLKNKIFYSVMDKKIYKNKKYSRRKKA